MPPCYMAVDSYHLGTSFRKRSLMCLEEAGLDVQVPSMRKIDGGTWIRGISREDLASPRTGTQQGLTQLASTLESRGPASEPWDLRAAGPYP